MKRFFDKPPFPSTPRFLFSDIYILSLTLHRDKLEHLEGKALSLKPSSLVAMKEKLSSSSSGATPQSGGYSKLNDSDRIFENFPITEMQLPTLFNLILSPHGEEALQLGVPSPPTLLYDLSLSNISSSPVWDTTKSPPDPLDPKEGKSVNPLSATKSDEDSPSKEQDTVNDEMKIGRKLRFWKS